MSRDMEALAARGFAAARCTGASQHVEIFEIDGDQMRSAEPSKGWVVKWGYCNRDRLLTPVLPTMAEARNALRSLAAQEPT